MGLGFLYRLRVVKTDWSLDQSHPVWGANVFGLAKIVKAISLRIELDGSSHAKQANVDGSTYRDWRWTFLTGIQSNFKISKSFTGNIQMLYNFDKSLKDVFPDRLLLRIGVQYRLPVRKPITQQK